MRWPGYWMVALAGVHMCTSIALFGPEYASMVDAGLVASVETDAQKAALWFAVGGLLMFAIGLCLLDVQAKPRALGWVLTAIGGIGAILVPASGFWFLLPPALALSFPRAEVEST